MTENQQSDNQFDEFEESPGGSPQPPSSSGRNRPFLIAIGLIGTLFVIGLVILLISLFSKGTQQTSQARQQADLINAQNTAVAATATADQMRIINLQQTLDAAAKAPTATPTPTVTPTEMGGTPTSVLAIPTATPTPTNTVSAADASKTAVVLTKVAQGTKIGVGGYPGPNTPVVNTPGVGTPNPAGTLAATSTALPTTGFADEVGLPGLLGLAALLLVVIVLARRVRTSH